jgi:hypothetical protein
MCILPNFRQSDLEELRKNSKEIIKKAETVKIIVPEKPLLKEPI